MGFSRKTTLARRRGPSPVAAAADALATELNRLERLELGELRLHFRNRSGRTRISHVLLLRVLAYRIQVDACGDASRDTRRLLDRLGSIATGSPAEGLPSAVPPLIGLRKRGYVLLRERRPSGASSRARCSTVAGPDGTHDGLRR